MDAVKPAEKPSFAELQDQADNRRAKQANQQSDAESLNVTKRVAEGQKPDHKKPDRRDAQPAHRDGVAAAAFLHNAFVL